MAAQCIKAMLCQMLRPSSSYGHAAQARGTANDQTEAADSGSGPGAAAAVRVGVLIVTRVPLIANLLQLCPGKPLGPVLFQFSLCFLKRPCDA